MHTLTTSWGRCAGADLNPIPIPIPNQVQATTGALVEAARYFALQPSELEGAHLPYPYPYPYP